MIPLRMATERCGCQWELGVGWQRCIRHQHWKARTLGEEPVTREDWANPWTERQALSRMRRAHV